MQDTRDDLRTANYEEDSLLTKLPCPVVGIFVSLARSHVVASVLSDIWVKTELSIPLEPESNVLSTGNASICLSPPSKLKFTVLFGSSPV